MLLVEPTRYHFSYLTIVYSVSTFMRCVSYDLFIISYCIIAGIFGTCLYSFIGILDRAIILLH